MRQTCRSKHKVLVLKCYPKYQKSAVDVKPNPSELSYLLYYASTRRSKLPKVGAFLERRTISDVRRGRIWDVQITLRILKALIDKTPRDLPLYAHSVLNILETVLSSKDLTTAEDSIATFESFCEHHDGPSLAASQDYLRLFEGVLGRYARLALDPMTVAKENVIVPVAMRWRTVGLRAINCVTSSEMLSLDGVGQLATAMSVILENLATHSGEGLRSLQRRAQVEQQAEDEKVMNRRMSLATVRTGETTADAHPVAPFLPTAAETDRAAQEKVALMALNCLKGIYTTNNRGQIRAATGLVLDFILTRVPASTGTAAEKRPESRGGQSWATALLEMLAQSVAVQDRYIILVAAVETLVGRPVVEDDLRQQLLLASLIGSLLRSDVNLIGLSVMDVLVDLIRRLLSVLELGSAEVDPQMVALQSVRSHSSEKGVDPMRDDNKNLPSSDGKSQLVQKLRGCIGDLATHVYYSDQTSDMVSTILFRIRRSPQAVLLMNSAVGSTDDGVGAGDGLVTPNHGSPSIHLKSTEYFLSAPARVIGLKAVTEVLQVANLSETFSRSATSSRNRVGIEVWEGSQWLLRDRDGHVRKGYVMALLAWLKYEVNKSSVRALAEDRTTSTKPSGRADQEGFVGSFRSSYLKSHSMQPGKLRFLGLLHVAIYDHALENVDSSAEITLLHVLLCSLVEQLSVVAVKHSLPMIFRLQEEIPSIESAAGKIRLASLVHGYFWQLSERFEFESTWIGREISNEIGRRKSKGMWMAGVQVPAITTLDRLSVPEDGTSSERDSLPLPTVQFEALRTFDHRGEIIELIGKAYAASIVSPPGSPSNSPTRKQTMPILDSPPSSSTIAPPDSPLLPEDVRTEMSSEWARETMLARYHHHQSETSKSASMNGSRRGGILHGGSGRDLLAVAAMGMMNGHAHAGRHSPHHQHLHQHQHQHLHINHQQQQQSQSPPSPVAATGLLSGNNNDSNKMGSIPRLRQLSLLEGGGGALREEKGSSTPISTSSRSSVVRVDDLKRVLAGSGDSSTGMEMGMGIQSPLTQTPPDTRIGSSRKESTKKKSKTSHAVVNDDLVAISAEMREEVMVEQQQQQQQQRDMVVMGGVGGGGGVETMDFAVRQIPPLQPSLQPIEIKLDGNGNGNGNGKMNEDRNGNGDGNGNGSQSSPQQQRQHLPIIKTD